MPSYSSSWGFTLVELVVVIVIVGILSAVGGLIITNHIQGYVDLSRRAELVDSAESALRRMQRDIRAAVPNSVHTWSNGQYQGITFLHTAAGGRYRAQAPENATGFNMDRILSFDEPDDEFAMLGKLLTNSSGDVPSEVRNGTVVIYNTGQPPLDAYNSTNNISPILGIDNATTFSPLFRIDSKKFPYASPLQHFQIMDEQVRYVWDSNDDQRTLKRYRRSAGDPNDPESENPDHWGNGTLISEHVSQADFIYEPGTQTRSGLMTLKITLKEEGESVTLLHQVHVLNTP